MIRSASFLFIPLILIATLTTGCGGSSSSPPYQQGLASWYGPGFHGKQTASGEKFNKNRMTAAHRTLPFGTEVRVTNVANDKSVKVEINDRGPFVQNRVIDLSEKAFGKIADKDEGLVKVTIELVD